VGVRLCSVRSWKRVVSVMVVETNVMRNCAQVEYMSVVGDVSWEGQGWLLAQRRLGAFSFWVAGDPACADKHPQHVPGDASDRGAIGITKELV
jgi:hypothetical protein